MNRIRYTLLSDGSSDKMLMPILDWLLRRHCPNYALEPEWADLPRLRLFPKKLPERIKKTLEFYDPDLLFIHRDEEGQTFELRRRQIINALAGQTRTPAVCVIPVRMQEAWLLFNECAIRKAAGNPNGRMSLQMPTIGTIEALPNPKQVLFDLISNASGLSPTRRKKLRPQKLAHLISQSIDDFTPLNQLSAFRALEQELSGVVRDAGWDA
jgi:hypothetical protein